MVTQYIGSRDFRDDAQTREDQRHPNEDKMRTCSTSRPRRLKDFAFKISVNAALCDRGDEASPLNLAEFKQIMDKESMTLCTSLRPY
jgi:hypothetical protein